MMFSFSAMMESMLMSSKVRGLLMAVSLAYSPRRVTSLMKGKWVSERVTNRSELS